MGLLTLINLAMVASSQAIQTSCPDAPSCDPATCVLPDCFCSGQQPDVGGDDRPQIVYLTFDDALSSQASSLFYDELFGTPTEPAYTNPNGCGIRATHYVTHSYTDYSLVNRWWRFGHEMASHSVTHRNNITYWQTMSEEEWAAEMVGQRRITAQFANIDPCEVSGMRSPFLQGGGDPMYAMLQHNNFSYDCTWPSRAYGFTDAENGLYPYTLDYKSKQDCEILPCPSCSHPGLWVQPMLDLEDEWLGGNPSDPNLGNPCSMLDACTIIPHDQYGEQDPEQVYHMLMKNFLRVYEGDTDEFGEFSEGNRAPWGLYMHAAWFFGQDWHFQGYKKFIQEIASYNDTWIVPVSAGIAYMQERCSGSSCSNSDLLALGKDGGPFQCKDIEEQTGKYDKDEHKCGAPRSCRFGNVTLPSDGVFGQERYMTICSSAGSGRQDCPQDYPWLEEPCAGNTPCADCVL